MTGQYTHHHSFHGIWDDDAFYDLETDPSERHNLIDVPVCRQQIEAMQLSLVEAFARGTTEGKDGAT